MITPAELKTKVEELAAAHPSTVYSKPRHGRGRKTCFYTRGDCGAGVGCIFGQALVAIDPTIRPWLEQIDVSLGSSGIQDVLEELRSDGRISKYDKVFLQWCDTVQLSQDDGYPWAEAVSNAAG